MTTGEAEGEVNFTPIQRMILAVLADGEAHRRQEVIDALPEPEYRTSKCLRVHMHYLRKRLEPRGETIVCVYRGGLYYRHVRLLRPKE